MGRIYLLPKYAFNLGFNNAVAFGEPTTIVEADCVSSFIDLLMSCSFIEQNQIKIIPPLPVAYALYHSLVFKYHLYYFLVCQ